MRRLFASFRRWTDRPAVAVAITGAVVLVLVLLAVVQYRWIGQVSEAERERLQSGLEGATQRFAGDFNGEFARLVQALNQGRPRVGPDTPQEYADRFARWRESAPFPGIARGLYVAHGAELSVFEQDGVHFVPIHWPERLAPLRARLESRVRSLGDPGTPMTLLSFEEDVPALVTPLTPGRPPDWVRRGEQPPSPPPPARPEGWLIAELDLDYLRTRFLPELVSRHFSPEYAVEVIRRADPRQPIYRSHPDARLETATPDAAIPLLEWRPPGPGLGPPAGGPGRPRRRMEGQGAWEVLVRHRSGSLEAMVERVRLRT